MLYRRNYTNWSSLKIRIREARKHMHWYLLGNSLVSAEFPSHSLLKLESTQWMRQEIWGGERRHDEGSWMVSWGTGSYLCPHWRVSLRYCQVIQTIHRKLCLSNCVGFIFWMHKLMPPSSESQNCWALIAVKENKGTVLPAHKVLENAKCSEKSGH